MKAIFAAALVAASVLAGSPALAQDAAAPQAPAQNNALDAVIRADIPAERLALATKVLELSGTARLFDEILPNIAEQAKNEFIKANPQMQLGIIAVVDRIAVQMVARRGELNGYLARIWASGFTDDELQELIDFYGTDTGKKFSIALPQILAVQTAAAQEWGRSVSQELSQKVSAELRASVSAEQEALQSDIAGPAAGAAQPQPQPQQ